MESPLDSIGDISTSTVAASSGDYPLLKVDDLNIQSLLLDNHFVDDTQTQCYSGNPIPSGASVLLDLPIEIWQDIFLRCVDEDIEPSHMPKDTMMKALRISHVSQYMRHIALNTPQFWSYLRIGSCSDTFIDLIKCFLDRSATCSLEITIVEDNARTDFGPIIVLLSDHSSRWEHFYFSGTIASFTGYRTNFEDCRLLQSIEIYTSDVNESPLESEKIIFQQADQLRHVILNSGMGRRHIDLPWHQLDRLKLSSMELGACMDVLEHCTNLQWLSVTIRTYSGGVIPHTNIWTFPKLSYLSVFFLSDADHGSRMLDKIILPKLDVLRVCYHDTYLKRHHKALMSFLRRSQCRATHLDIDISRTDLAPQDLAAILAEMPHLDELVMRASACEALDETTLVRMSHTKTHPATLLPKLKRLFLDSYEVDEMLLDMIRSRRPTSSDNQSPNPPGTTKEWVFLEHLELDSLKGVEDVCLVGLRELQGDGLLIAPFNESLDTIWDTLEETASGDEDT